MSSIGATIGVLKFLQNTAVRSHLAVWIGLRPCIVDDFVVNVT